ncbi:MAG: helix-turn-helix domain-containing protein [Myxococcota bacterium]|jgi:transcriptional regulator with XRE-family HTH domain|nr:helix-turn-helix domain-containing protein [Myxococcota bacterium]
MASAFSDRLRLARLNANLSQGAIARAIGVSTVTVWRWETGKMEPTAKHIALLAAACGVSTDALLVPPRESEAA